MHKTIFPFIFVVILTSVKLCPTDSLITPRYIKRPSSPLQAHLQTPHSGRHFIPSHPLQEAGLKDKNRKARRFFEGWYYRVSIPEHNASFAFIYSIEDSNYCSKNPSPLSLAACQIMGPNDEYLVQSTRDVRRFWGYEDSATFGCVFGESPKENWQNHTALPADEFENMLETQTGFQVLPNRLQGRLDGHDGSVNLENGIAGTCTWDVSFDITSGYGADDKQRSTAGWLSYYPVFEPHWQITVADGRANGTIVWNGEAIKFSNAPLYCEKNWGGTFPKKWHWLQCNSFGPNEELSVTAVGAIRSLPLGKEEDVGLVTIHYNGTFYEAVPWLGSVSWSVDPWGLWVYRARCINSDGGGTASPFEVEVVANCTDEAGVVLRAPTKEDGLVYFCRDSFYAHVTVTLWELEKKEHEWVRGRTIIDAATSDLCAVEVGGGPWWNPWSAVSNMKQPFRGLVRLPYVGRRLKRRLFGDRRRRRE